MGWRYFGLIVVLSMSFGGGVWMSHAGDTRVCQIDLRSDAREALERLAKNKAFTKLPDGTLATDQKCRLRLSHDDGAELDHVFDWVAIVKGSDADTDGLGIILKTDETTADRVYEQALDFLVHLNFSNEAVDRLEAWYREARHGQARARALSLFKDAHRPAVTLAVARGTDDENLWRVVFEIRP
jgi:hypothetical protein